MDENETALFTLINAARRDPLGMAESLGMNRDEILNSLPELSDILINGLPEFSFSEALYRSATDHNRDMLAQNYYAYASIDGKTPEQRMMEAGYVPTAAGEVLGMMFFNNFIDPDVAVSRIFENIFRDELSPDRAAPRCILNPDFDDIGLSMKGGIYQLDNFKSNIYLLVCDFGSSAESYEMELLTLVNQLRNRPAAVARNFGLDVDELVALSPEYAELFAEGLPPVTLNSLLYAVADAHIKDMLQNEYWGSVSPEGVTPFMRIETGGYAPVWAAESQYRLTTCDNVVSPSTTVSVIFKNMVLNAFVNKICQETSMVSRSARDAGIRVVATASDFLSGICGDQVHIAVCDYAAPVQEEEGGHQGEEEITESYLAALTGIVYVDLNENGLYDPDEGIAGQKIKIANQTDNSANVPIQTIFTGETGGYMIPLEPGTYRIWIADEKNEEIQGESITIQTDNVWLPFLMNDSVKVSE